MEFTLKMCVCVCFNFQRKNILLNCFKKLTCVDRYADRRRDGKRDERGKE